MRSNVLVIDRGEMRRDVLHHDSVRELLDGRAGCVLACGRPVRPCFPGDNRNELVGRIEIAYQEQILDLGDDRRHQLAPTGRVVLDAQEIREQQQVESPQGTRRHGLAPGRHSLRRVVVDAFDLHRLDAGAGQLTSVGPGHIGGVGYNINRSLTVPHIDSKLPVWPSGVVAASSCANPRR